MLDSATKEMLLKEFRSLLEEDADSPEPERKETRKKNAVDLHTLLSELVSLKNETRLQARHFKTALQELQEALARSAEENNRIKGLVEQTGKEAEQRREEEMRALLIALLELRDRIEAALVSARSFKPGRGIFTRRKRESAFASGFIEGQILSLKRLDQLLDTQEVRPIETVGRPLDPHRMQAVEIDRRADQPEGVVTAELRRGYLWKDEVLRTAEVKINKVH